MTPSAAHEGAAQPEDLSRFFLERANAGDVEGLVALYQPDAVLAFPPRADHGGPDRDPGGLSDAPGHPADVHVRRAATRLAQWRSRAHLDLAAWRQGDRGGGSPTARWHLALGLGPTKTSSDSWVLSSTGFPHMPPAS
jgi:hypothetical protein